MDGPNDNRRFLSTTNIEKSLSSDDEISTKPSFASDLVTKTKLLTREEECTLKTALAFVVIKARATANSKAALQNSPISNCRHKRQRTMDDVIDNDSSVLDHLFGDTTRKLPDSLECTGDQKHIDYMFRAAKTLAQTWLVTHQEKGQISTGSNKALVGATGHLAHQLQVLLLANESKASVEPSSTAIPEEKQRTRYRRPSLSSKSATDSMCTPSASSRMMGSAAMLVTPSTNNSKINSRSSQSSKKPGTESNCVEGKNDPNSRGDEALFRVQKWIRSTLLDEEHYNENADTENGTADKVSRTILSREKTTVLDLLSSFHVYTTMIPQLARISPPLIGHIFQVVARLVRDLYNNKVAVIGEDYDSIDGKLLDHLATSALTLLEVCWTTEILAGGRESHRSFLLLSLQEILGDLLIPLSRQDLAAEHYRLTISEARRCSAFRRETLMSQPNRRGFRSEITNHRQTLADFTRAKNLARTDSVARKIHIPRTLETEAKLLLRLGVYRLVLMGKKG